MPGRVLLIDDDADMRDTLVAGLSRRGFDPVARASADEALAFLEAEDVDVVVTDLRMGGMSGIELCRRLSANRPDIPVIVITAFGSFESAVDAMRAGAYDFVSKPFEPKALDVAIARAVQHRTLTQEVKRLRREVASARATDELLGRSPAIAHVRDLIARLAESDVSVLITGESGTGKEVVARALHRGSRRHDGPFVAINCAALPEALLESELFGHVKGAFTDAKAPRTGLFVQANGGTLFLDEIGELPLVLQVKLLRALQERRVRPVGGESEIGYDARIVAATNRDLETAVEDKHFREDLYFRLNVVQIDLPPLRARQGDVLLLAQHFLAQAAARAGKPIRGLATAAAERLAAYPWPGNVRELQNAMERAVALTRFEEITPDDLPEKIRRNDAPAPGPARPDELVSLDELERRHILRVMEAVDGHRAQAAEILGIDRKTLYRKLDRLRPAKDRGA